MAALATDLSNLSVCDLAEGRLDLAQTHLEEALTEAAMVRDATTSAYINVNLGLLALQRDDAVGAQIRYREALRLVPPPDTAQIVTACALLGLTLCAVADPARDHDAATLHGFLDVWFGDPQHYLDPTENRLRRQDLARLAVSLGDAELTAARARGATLPLERALALARSVSTPPTE